MSRTLALVAGLAVSISAAAQDCSTNQLGWIDIEAPVAVRVVDDVAYIATLDNRFFSCDVTIPHTPRPMSMVEGPGPFGDFAVQAGIAYVACHSPEGFDIIDVSSPWTMMRIDTLPLEVAQVEVTKDRLVITTTGMSGRELRVFGLADPMAPTQLADVELPGEPTGLALSNGFAFVTVQNAADPALVVIDLRPSVIPETPQIISTITLPSVPAGLDVDAGLAVVGGLAGTEVALVDVTDPEIPVLTSLFDIGHPGLDVEIKAGKAFLASADGGMTVLNVLNPALPEIIGQVGTPSQAVDVALNRSCAFISDTTGGVFMVDAWTWLACTPADQADPFRELSGHDIGVFVTGFESGNPHTDLNGNHVFDLGDVMMFVDLFLQGCTDMPEG